LPLVAGDKTDVVNENLFKYGRLPRLNDEDFRRVKYRSKFKLDYLAGGAGVGLGTSSFGGNTAMAGGVTAFFGDVLGNNQLITGLSLNGDIFDAGGQVIYVNRKNRLAWGAKLGHIPYRSGTSYFPVEDTLQTNSGTLIPVRNYPTDLLRIFEDQAGVFAHFPFSRQQRIEAGVTGFLYSYRNERYDNYYDYFGRLVLQEKTKLDAPSPFGLQSLDAAYVGDNAIFGVASPLRGYRFRVGGQQYFGRWNFQSLTLDARKYVRLKPITVAGRFLHFGRYGTDSKNLPPVFLGEQGIMHGYAFNSINQSELDQLIGTKFAVANLEVRLPFTGPERLALLKSKFLFTEIGAFLDAGSAFIDMDQISDTVVFSTGFSLRINLFGALILEPYYAWQLSGADRKGVFGFNFVPGW
ncbi:MAG: tolB protein precursor, partial [Saprospiraceae bacterium]|nr:tolB protein precursor [Saprospiraceae bacterium]